MPPDGRHNRGPSTDHGPPSATIGSLWPRSSPCPPGSPTVVSASGCGWCGPTIGRRLTRRCGAQSSIRSPPLAPGPCGLNATSTTGTCRTASVSRWPSGVPARPSRRRSRNHPSFLPTPSRWPRGASDGGRPTVGRPARRSAVWPRRIAAGGCTSSRAGAALCCLRSTASTSRTGWTRISQAGAPRRP